MVPAPTESGMLGRRLDMLLITLALQLFAFLFLFLSCSFGFVLFAPFGPDLFSLLTSFASRIKIAKVHSLIFFYQKCADVCASYHCAMIDSLANRTRTIHLAQVTDVFTGAA